MSNRRFENIKEPCTKKILDKINFSGLNQVPLAISQIIAEYALYVRYGSYLRHEEEFKFFKLVQYLGPVCRKFKLPKSPSKVDEINMEVTMNGDFYLFYPGFDAKLKKEKECHGVKRIERYNVFKNNWTLFNLPDFVHLYDASRLSVINSTIWISPGILSNDDLYVLCFEPAFTLEKAWRRFLAPKPLFGKDEEFCLEIINIGGRICMPILTNKMLVFLILNGDTRGDWTTWWSVPVESANSGFAVQDYITGLSYINLEFDAEDYYTHFIFYLNVLEKQVIWKTKFDSEKFVIIELDCFGRTGTWGPSWPRFSLDAKF